MIKNLEIVDRVYDSYKGIVGEELAKRAKSLMEQYAESSLDHLQGLNVSLHYILYASDNDKKEVEKSLARLEKLTIEDVDLTLQAISSITKNGKEKHKGAKDKIKKLFELVHAWDEFTKKVIWDSIIRPSEFDENYRRYNYLKNI